MDNASYSEDNDLSKAKAFVTACRFLLLKLPTRAAHAGEEVQLDPRMIQDEMKTALRWISCNSTESPVKFNSFENLR
jgi:hypothetical protein